MYTITTSRKKTTTSSNQLTRRTFYSVFYNGQLMLYTSDRTIALNYVKDPAVEPHTQHTNTKAPLLSSNNNESQTIIINSLQ